jgi:hypothetical protein
MLAFSFIFKKFTKNVKMTLVQDDDAIFYFGLLGLQRKNVPWYRDSTSQLHGFKPSQILKVSMH